MSSSCFPSNYISYQITSLLSLKLFPADYKFSPLTVPFILSSAAMEVSNSFKRDFLRKLLLGLQQCGIPSKSMSLLERKRAIKLSSDVALAATRDRGAQWSRALIINLSKQEPNKTFVRNMLGKEFDRLSIPLHSPLTCKKVQSRSILKRSSLMRRTRKTAAKSTVRATTLAKRMQKKRTQILKALVPGGQYMDELSSLEEMVDYVLYLKAQVEVMQFNE